MIFLIIIGFPIAMVATMMLSGWDIIVVVRSENSDIEKFVFENADADRLYSSESSSLYAVTRTGGDASAEVHCLSKNEKARSPAAYFAFTHFLVVYVVVKDCQVISNRMLFAI